MKQHNLGGTMSALRKGKGWTQEQLASKLNVDVNKIVKWEKGESHPELDALVTLANVLEVSLDYLVTGKEAEPKVVFMSKAEYCVAHNDLSMLDKINYSQKDENNKCLIDYIIQYDNADIFSALCQKHNSAIVSFDILTALRFCLLSNRLELLNKKTFRINRDVVFEFDSLKEILALLPVGALEYFKKVQGMTKYSCILPESFFTMIVTDKRINEDTIDFLLGKQRDRQCVWYHAFPYLIDACYKAENSELLNRLLDLSEENNQYAYDVFQRKHDYRDGWNYTVNYFFVTACNSALIMPGSTRNGHGLVRILESTLRAALERSDFDLIERMNRINIGIKNYCREYSSGSECAVITDDEIRVAKLKLDKTISETELLVQSAIHDGLLVIDELLEIKDVSAIEDALNKYPVSKYEIEAETLRKLEEALYRRDWRNIFEYAVDNDERTLMEYAKTCNDVSARQWLTSKQALPLSYGGWRTPYEYLAKNEKNNKNLKYFKLEKKNDMAKTVGEVVEYIKLCKKEVVKNAKEKDYATTIASELTEQYFRNELKKGNVELAVVKLCVRLEAELKSKYHYEGDFSEMLSQYCSQHGSYRTDDDYGSGTGTEEFVSYLHKLRKYRNSIVHAENKGEGMTKEELDFCINYICNMR